MVRSLLLGVFIFASQAHAGFLLEPYGGGQFNGSYNEEKTVANGSFSSFVYGGRVGLETHGFLIGGEYLGDNHVPVNVTAPNGFAAKDTQIFLSNNHFGGFIGADMMFPLSARLIATYFFSSQAQYDHQDDKNNVDFDKTNTGSGFKIELDAHLARYLTLGVAYYKIVYTKQRDNLTGLEINNPPTANQSAVIVLVSVPLDIPFGGGGSSHGGGKSQMNGPMPSGPPPPAMGY